MTAESNESWWPFAEAILGTHRYAEAPGIRFAVDFGAGVGWDGGERGSIRLGLQYGRIGADPPYWHQPDVSYAHHMFGILIGVGWRAL